MILYTPNLQVELQTKSEHKPLNPPSKETRHRAHRGATSHTARNQHVSDKPYRNPLNYVILLLAHNCFMAI